MSQVAGEVMRYFWRVLIGAIRNPEIAVVLLIWSGWMWVHIKHYWDSAD